MESIRINYLTVNQEIFDMEAKLNDKKIIHSWAMYDWANSAYALVISTAIFPIYFEANTPKIINIFGLEFPNTSVFSYSVSISFLIIALLSPILSGIADYSGRRMNFLKFFTVFGAVSCIALYWFTGIENLWIGLVFFILASVGFSGGVIFYNSYLPQIASEDRFDQVSARGFAYGYIGSVILLVTNLLLIFFPDILGLENTQHATRVSFVMVGLWWMIFAFYAFRRFPKDQINGPRNNIISKGIKEFSTAAKKVFSKKNLSLFLLAYFFYTAGVNTVIYLATPFAKKVIGMKSEELIITVIIIQLVGIAGAYLFAYVAKIRGNRTSLYSMLAIWVGVCLMAYFVDHKTQFFVIAGLVGLVMGGIQSQSRAIYSKLIEEKESNLASYYSFYDVVMKCSVVLGTFCFGYVEQMTGSIRNSILVLIVLFVVSMILLAFVKMTDKDGIRI